MQNTSSNRSLGRSAPSATSLLKRKIGKNFSEFTFPSSLRLNFKNSIFLPNRSPMKLINHLKIKDRCSFSFKALVVIYICLVSLTIRFYPISPGLDRSWVFALNFFADQNIIFGKDVFFSYGPLGYLILPMDIGSNFFNGIIFQLFIWCVFSFIEHTYENKGNN